MRTLNLSCKFMTLALASSMFMMTSCDKEEDGATDNGGKTELENGATIPSNITADLKLSKGNIYKLSGGTHVKEGATLFIEEGVTIEAQYDETPDYILIEQGAKIDAQGTAQNPIVMTSNNKKTGAWGGIHICGKAHTNIQAKTGKSEIGNATYGGDIEDDNSGILRYIRLEYTGFALDAEHEANGVTFYGVGNGTNVEYLQAYKGKDDGFEWFGGSVNVRNLVATSCGDDSFDWTEGWNGKAQFLVAYQEASESCDCLMECDSNGDNNSLEPIAHPTISNITLIGNNNAEKNNGLRLREGTEVTLYNAIITGKENALRVESEGTIAALQNGKSILEYVSISGVVKSEDASKYSNDSFIANGNNLSEQSFNFTDKFVGTTPDGTDASQKDSFFQKAEYRGAVSSENNWTMGWTL